jgi:hypothetical protein
MIWDDPTDMFFSLDSSAGALQGNKHYTDSVSGNEDGYSKMIEHNNIVYIFFRKPSLYRITAYSMNTSSFTTSVQMGSLKYIYTIFEGKLSNVHSLLDDQYLYIAGAASFDCYLGKIEFPEELGNLG